MDFDYIADNEDQMVRDILESEEKEKSIGKNKDKDKKPVRKKNNYRNNYDDESREDY